MFPYLITTDSTCDLPEDYLGAEAEHLKVIPISFTVAGTTYYSHEELSPHDFYDRMRAGEKAVTAQINLAEASEFFEDKLKKGYDILHIAFSSALSGTYQNMCLAAQEMMEKYPDHTIRVIDSKCASLGEGLLVHHALEWKKKGLSLEAAASQLEKDKLRLCHYFTVEDLEYLRRGGRVSKTAAVLGTMLSVKPVLHVDNEGRLIPLSKVRGRKQSLKALVDGMSRMVGKTENSVVFIGHGDSLEDAEYVRELVKEQFGIQKFLISTINAVIGSHSGPGTIALFFFGEKREG